MPPLVDTKILFRLELSYAVDSEYPLNISIQCGYASCERYVDAPENNPVLCVPIKIASNTANSLAWANAINEAYEHLMWHQTAREERN